MSESCDNPGGDDDPISAPPGPYLVQPGQVGRLLFITGPPGSGKSTSAQTLAREKGRIHLLVTAAKYFNILFRICVL